MEPIRRKAFYQFLSQIIIDLQTKSNQNKWSMKKWPIEWNFKTLKILRFWVIKSFQKKKKEEDNDRFLSITLILSCLTTFSKSLKDGGYWPPVKLLSTSAITSENRNLNSQSVWLIECQKKWKQHKTMLKKRFYTHFHLNKKTLLQICYVF